MVAAGATKVGLCPMEQEDGDKKWSKKAISLVLLFSPFHPKAMPGPTWLHWTPFDLGCSCVLVPLGSSLLRVSLAAGKSHPAPSAPFHRWGN